MFKQLHLVRILYVQPFQVLNVSRLMILLFCLGLVGERCEKVGSES